MSAAPQVAAGTVLAVGLAALATHTLPQRDADPAPQAAAGPLEATLLPAGSDAIALEQGRVYYVQLCLPCHGERGDGRGEWAYRVTPRPLDLRAPRTQKRSDNELLEIIAEPLLGTPMLGWKDQLSPPQRGQLLAYLRLLGTPHEQQRR